MFMIHVCVCARACVYLCGRTLACTHECVWFICIVQCNWACLTWKSAIEIKSLGLVLKQLEYATERPFLSKPWFLFTLTVFIVIIIPSEFLFDRFLYIFFCENSTLSVIYIVVWKRTTIRWCRWKKKDAVLVLCWRIENTVLSFSHLMKQGSGQVVTRQAVFVLTEQVQCPVPSCDGEVVQVAVSNNGVNMSAPLPYICYNSVCDNCTLQGCTPRVRGFSTLLLSFSAQGCHPAQRLFE